MQVLEKLTRTRHLSDAGRRRDPRLDFMTDDDMHFVDSLLARIETNRGRMGDIYDRWEKEQIGYAADQPIVEKRPNSRVNIINANIEGQVSAAVDQNLAVTVRGEGPSDHGYADWARIGLDWTLRKNQIKQVIDVHERRRFLFGAAWLKVFWDPDAFDGFGLARLAATPLQSIFIDEKVTDPREIESAEYIAEVMQRSKTWALSQYGEIAHNIHLGGTDRAAIFTKDTSEDDEDAFWLVQLWTKTDGKLRLIEMSDDGVLLFDSFKRLEDGKWVDKKRRKPFYRYNRYPYFLTILYPEEGKLYGFGDGKLLRPLQDMINDLYDQIRRAARPNRVFFDPNSEVELEDLDEDDGPVPCSDPNQNVRVVEVGRVNPALWQLLEAIHLEVQRVTRFSELMLGQPAGVETATEASIQQQQGFSSVEHKKGQLRDTLVSVCEYIVDLMMENYTEGRWFRLDEDVTDYRWIDFRQMDKVPVLMPPTEAFIRQFREKNPDAEPPKWMQVKARDGTGMTKSVELDIDINLGQGLPKNKAFLWRLMQSIAGLKVQDRNAITWAEFRRFARDFLGLPLDEDAQASEQIAPSGPMPLAIPGPGRPPGESADTEGLTANGRPSMSALPTEPVRSVV